MKKLEDLIIRFIDSNDYYLYEEIYNILDDNTEKVVEGVKNGVSLDNLLAQLDLEIENERDNDVFVNTDDMFSLYLRDIRNTTSYENKAKNIMLAEKVFFYRNEAIKLLNSKGVSCEKGLISQKITDNIYKFNDEIEIQAAKKIFNDFLLARDEMVEYNLRLVVSYAKNHRYIKADFNDIIGYGNVGLIYAVEKFDHRIGASFSTYAYFWINQSVLRYADYSTGAFEYPAHIKSLCSKMKNINTRYFNIYGRDANIDEMANELNIDKERAAFYLTLLEPIFSLNNIVSTEDNGGNAELIDFIPDQCVDVENTAVKACIHEEIRKEMENLTEREQFILNARFGFDDGEVKTLSQIGEMLGLTRERVRQIEAKSLKKMKILVLRKGY